MKRCICGNELPKGRRKYCSRSCGSKAWNENYRKKHGIERFQPQVVKCLVSNCDIHFVQKFPFHKFCCTTHAKRYRNKRYAVQEKNKPGRPRKDAPPRPKPGKRYCHRCYKEAYGREDGFCSDSCRQVWEEAPGAARDLLELWGMV